MSWNAMYVCLKCTFFFSLPNWALMEIYMCIKTRIIDLEKTTRWNEFHRLITLVVFTDSHTRRHIAMSLKANIRWKEIVILENSAKTSWTGDAND